jgi:hypothetical protein
MLDVALPQVDVLAGVQQFLGGGESVVIGRGVRRVGGGRGVDRVGSRGIGRRLEETAGAAANAEASILEVVEDLRLGGPREDGPATGGDST